MDRKWIDEAFKQAVESDSFYAQKSKLKPCKEKINWWIGSPGEVVLMDINVIRKELDQMGKEDSIEYVANKLAEAKVFSMACASNFGKGLKEMDEITSAIIKRASEIEDKVFKKLTIEVLENLYRALGE